MPWFALTLSSVFVLASAELLQQYLLNKETTLTERTSTVLMFLTEWLLSIPLVFALYSFDEIFGWISPGLVLRILAVTSIASFAMIFYLRSLRVKSISFSQIFGASSIPVSTTLGIIFLGEGISGLKFLGIALI